MIEAVGRGVTDQTWRIVTLACCLAGIVSVFGTLLFIYLVADQP